MDYTYISSLHNKTACSTSLTRYTFSIFVLFCLLGLVVSQLDILAALENCMQVFTAFSSGVSMDI